MKLCDTGEFPVVVSQVFNPLTPHDIPHTVQYGRDGNIVMRIRFDQVHQLVQAIDVTACILHFPYPEVSVRAKLRMPRYPEVSVRAKLRMPRYHEV